MRNLSVLTMTTQLITLKKPNFELIAISELQSRLCSITKNKISEPFLPRRRTSLCSRETLLKYLR